MAIFKHKGVWVHPSTVGPTVGARHARPRPRCQEHGGNVDESAGLDVGQAILAFNFVDRLNNEMVRHYLPMVDNTVGKELGLKHRASRLATPEPAAGAQPAPPQPEHEESAASSSGAAHAASGVGASLGGRLSRVGSSDIAAESSPDMHLGGGGHGRPSAVGSRAASAVACSPEEEASRARGMGSGHSPGELGIGLEEDAAGWARQAVGDTVGDNSVAGRLGSVTELEGSEGLAAPKGVVRRPVGTTALHPGWPPTSESAASSSCGPRIGRLRTAESFAESGFLQQGSEACPRPPNSAPAAMGPGLSVMQASAESALDWTRLLCRPPPPPPDPDDPASSCASTLAVYGPGASRILKPGVHSKVLARRRPRQGLEGRQPSSLHGVAEPPRTARGRLEGCAEASLGGANSPKGTLRGALPGGSAGGSALPPSSASAADGEKRPSTLAPVVGAQAGAERASGASSEVRGSIVNAANRPSVARHSSSSNASGVGEAESSVPWPPGRSAPSSDHIENIVAATLRGDTPAGPEGNMQFVRRTRRMTNAVCPFLHEPMDRSTSVDLQCGHRFALSRLTAARRAADLCYNAGFARKDALICPLCGDQAGFNTPNDSNLLTTYSCDAAAYLGDLRRDWQQPLQLPMHSWMLGREAVERRSRGPLPRRA